MRTGLSAIGYTIIGICCLVLVIGASVGLEAAGLTWYAPWRANKQTEVLRNTEQYVTTQQAAMRDAWQRYLNPDATEGQRKAAIQDWCAAANRVDDQYVVPTDAKVEGRKAQCYGN